MKKLLLLLSLISFNAFATDRGVPCNSNSCKVKIVAKNSGGTDVTALDIGATEITAINKVNVGNTSASSTRSLLGFGGRSISSGNSNSTGIPAYAGTTGQANIIICSSQTGNNNNTYSAMYIVRSFHSNGSTWSEAVGVTYIGGGGLGANTGGNQFSFSCTPSCTDSAAIITVSATGNWQCQIYGAG